MTATPDPTADPTADLERAYIAEFLKRRGYTLDSLRDLPDNVAQELLKAASVYASGRLTEVETRSRYLTDMHGGCEAMPRHAPHGQTPPGNSD